VEVFADPASAKPRAASIKDPLEQRLINALRLVAPRRRDWAVTVFEELVSRAKRLR
jgi:hypothetical protein